MPPNTVDKARAREIIEAFFLEAPNRVVHFRRAPDRMIVLTLRGWWWVSRLDGELERLTFDGYELFTIGEEADIDPPPMSSGVARLPDGRMFLLTAPEQFRAFVAAMGGALPPADLAELLVRFQRGSRTAPPQYLILTLDELTKELEPEQIQAIPELIPFQAMGREDGGLALDFCAHALGRRGDPDSGTIRILRWRVEASGAHELTWSFRTIAERLPPRSWKELGILDGILSREKE